jgi:hypothetical protein
MDWTIKREMKRGVGGGGKGNMKIHRRIIMLS